MKKIIFMILMSTGMLLISSQAKAQEKQNTTQIGQNVKGVTQLHLSVEGMSCQSGCANGIDNKLKNQEGVVKSETTYDTGTSVIWYNKELISQKQIVNLIRDRGFKVKVKKEDQQDDL